MAFVKGQSGNPGGRPKVDRARATCRRAGPELMEKLIELALNSETPPAVRVAATKEVMDRGFGKPQQSVEFHQRPKTVKELTLAELLAIAARGSEGSGTSATGTITVQ